MVDDPFRTLAARVRMAGGYSKDATPYSEFLWADFYRRHMKLKAGRITAKVVQDALLLAHAHDTAYLPGWSGVIAQMNATAAPTSARVADLLAGLAIAGSAGARSGGRIRASRACRRRRVSSRFLSA